MFSKYLNTMATVTLICIALAGVGRAQDLQEQYNDDEARYLDNIRIDRYLDVEVWTNHLDGDFFVGDNVVINYRVNRDAFVVIYSIDSKGRVNMLFPTAPDQDNFVHGGVTNHLPGPEDDFDLIVSGPDGLENIQVIASRERFPIPDWYPVSGLVCDWDDRYEFMDYLNGKHFVRYGGQTFAFDRTALYVNEWEPNYFRPVYYPYYPSWTVCGNAYIDYPWGSTIYVDGIYWGCAPLYLPRVYVGWHTITVYNHWGHCWERDVHFTRYHTVVLNRDIIVPQPSIKSKYKEVRDAGYRDPVVHGYPKFRERQAVDGKMSDVRSKTTVAEGIKDKVGSVSSKRYVRGDSKLVATERGFETVGSSFGNNKGSGTASTKAIGTSGKPATTGPGAVKPSSYGNSKGTTGYGSGGTNSKGSAGTTVERKSDNSQSKDYYQKKSGSDSPKSRSTKSKIQRKDSGSNQGSKPAVKSTPSSGKQGGATKTGTVKPSTSQPKTSTGTTKSSGAKSKSGGGSSKKGGGK